MKLQHGVLLTILSMHSSVIEAGHHRIQHEHEMEAMMTKSGKSGSTSSGSYASKSGKVVQLVQSMQMEDDDAMSVVYVGKSGKEDAVEEAKSDKIAEMSKSGKSEDDDDAMSMSVVDDEVSVIYISKDGKAGKSGEMVSVHSHHVGKADKAASEMSKSGKYYDEDDDMSMSAVDDDMSYVAYTGKAGKAIDSKAGNAQHLIDAKASKAAYAYYGKSGKASYSMSMVEVDDDKADMIDDADGEWVPITTDATDAAITTIGATEPAASTESAATTTGSASITSTAAPDASTTAAAGQTTTFSETATSTVNPGFRSDLDKVLEDEILLMEEGGHGGENHVHGKSGETVEISSKIASGTHNRPDALQQQSDSATLSVSRFTIVAACIASLYALAL